MSYDINIRFFTRFWTSVGHGFTQHTESHVPDTCIPGMIYDIVFTVSKPLVAQCSYAAQVWYEIKCTSHLVCLFMIGAASSPGATRFRTYLTRERKKIFRSIKIFVREKNRRIVPSVESIVPWITLSPGPAICGHNIITCNFFLVCSMQHSTTHTRHQIADSCSPLGMHFS